MDTFKLWLEGGDLWGAVPHHDGRDVDYLSPAELYGRQSPPTRRLMDAMRVEDKGYLDNLRRSVRDHGIKQPLKLRGGQVDDGLHRLIVALDLNLPAVPVQHHEP